MIYFLPQLSVAEIGGNYLAKLFRLHCVRVSMLE